MQRGLLQDAADAAAAAAFRVHTGEASSSSSQQRLMNSPLCSCYVAAPHGWSSWDRQGGRCGAMFSLGVLVLVLHPVYMACTQNNSMSVWLTKLPSVLVVLEVVLRQLLPSLVSCSSSSSSDSSVAVGESRSFRSSGAAHLSVGLQGMLTGMLLGRADTYGGDQQQQLMRQAFCLAATQLKACCLAGTD